MLTESRLVVGGWWLARFATLAFSAKPEVSLAEPFKGGAVGGDHIRVNRLGSRDKPGVVLAQPSR
jgi:hypothetical protein